MAGQAQAEVVGGFIVYVEGGMGAEISRSGSGKWWLFIYLQREPCIP